MLIFFRGKGSVELFAAVGDAVEKAQAALLCATDNLSVVEVVVEALAFGDHPADRINRELRLLLAAAAVLLVLVDEHPGEAGDRVAVGVVGVGEGGAHVLWEVDIGGQCNGLEGGLDEFAGGVQHGAYAQVVGDGVLVRDVAQRAGDLRDEAGDAFVAARAEAGGPAYAGLRAGAHFLGPAVGNLREVVDEDGGGAGAVRAVGGADRQAGQLDVGVQFDEALVVPLGDLAKVDACQDLTAEADGLIDARQVVGGDDRGEGGRDVQDGVGATQDFARRGAGEGLVGHRGVTAAKVDGLLEELALPAAGNDRVVGVLD